MQMKKMNNVMKIWNIVEGPVGREDIPEEELEDIPPEAEAMLACRVEDEEGEVDILELWYPSFDDAYELVKYFSANIEPLEFPYD